MRPSARLQSFHFIGIGGAGMSSMAEILQAWGFTISGSDQQKSEVVERLQEKNISIFTGHRAENLQGEKISAVIYSSAIPNDNPEMVKARALGLPLIRRAELMGEMLRGQYSLGVAGTHGKTTTTTMLAKIWVDAKKHPTVLAGGITEGENLTALAGQGEGAPFIFEADEFDRSFLAMRPSSTIIGNIDSDHLDCYENLAAIKDAFITYSSSLPFFGALVVNVDDAGIADIVHRLPRNGPKLIGYGIEPEGQGEKAGKISGNPSIAHPYLSSQYIATDLVSQASGTTFSVLSQGKNLGSIHLKVPGIHNVYNALGAAVLSLEEGLSFDQIAKSLANYGGVKRRMEFRGEKSGIQFYDDYAHHPTEVAASIQAARSLGKGRLVVIFQPHLFSRTQILYKEFAQALIGCDLLFVLPIYASREKPITGVSGKLISEAGRGISNAPQIIFIENLDDLTATVSAQLHKGDCVVSMGAGDVGYRLGKIMAEYDRGQR